MKRYWPLFWLGLAISMLPTLGLCLLAFVVPVTSLVFLLGMVAGILAVIGGVVSGKS